MHFAYEKLFRQRKAVLAAGIVLGLLIFFGLRVALVKDDAVHHHANFALFIDGKRDKFDNFTFYEETASCNADMSADPKHRVHMHDNNNHIIHVHDSAVTWGDFFANLGYGLTNKSLQTDGGVFVNGANGKKLSLYLNGKLVDSVANRAINSEDVLLVDYSANDNLAREYGQIPKDAGEFNRKNDPTSCAGSQPLTFTDRLKRAFDFRN